MLKIADEIYSCIRNGWKMFNREGNFLAYFTKPAANGKVHKLREDGCRFLLDESGNEILRRSPKGIVTRVASDSKVYTWTKMPTGRYRWYNSDLGRSKIFL